MRAAPRADANVRRGARCVRRTRHSKMGERQRQKQGPRVTPPEEATAIAAPSPEAARPDANAVSAVHSGERLEPAREAPAERTLSPNAGARLGQRPRSAHARPPADRDPLGASMAKLDGAKSTTAAAESAPASKSAESEPRKADRPAGSDEPDESIEDRPLEVDIE